MIDASPKIPTETVEEIRGLLQSHRAKTWRQVTYEYQDDSEYVLFVIELDAMPLQRNAPDRMYAYSLLNTRIPRKPNGDDSWMVIFKYKGTVCDSLMNDVA